MKRLITFLMLGALCVAAAASAAKPPPKTQVLAAKNAAWACKALRTTMGTQAFLNAYFGRFGCAVFLAMILTFDYAMQSNLHPDNRPDISRIWYILAGFVLFTLVWTIRMLVRFGRVPRNNPAPK